MLKFRSVDELRKRILENPYVFIIISEAYNTLFTSSGNVYNPDDHRHLINPEETHQLLYGNVFAIAASKTKPLLDNKDPIVPLFESGASCPEIVTDSEVRMEEWLAAEESYLSGAEASVDATIKIVKRDGKHIIISVDEGKSDYIKLTLSNLSEGSDFVTLLQHKLKQFLEICRQLRVVPDQMGEGVQLECGKDIKRLPSDRFIYMDVANEPLATADKIGFRPFQVFDSKAQMQMGTVMCSLSNEVGELNGMAEKVIKSSAIERHSNIIDFTAAYLRLAEPMLQNCRKLYGLMPRKWTKLCNSLLKAVQDFEYYIPLRDLVECKDNRIKIMNIPSLVNRVSKLVTICEELERLGGELRRQSLLEVDLYINEIMRHIDSNLRRMTAAPTEGLADVERVLVSAAPKKNGIFANGSSKIIELSASQERILRRLAICRNPTALELLGDYACREKPHVAKACYQLAFLYNSTLNPQLLEKIEKVEKNIPVDNNPWKGMKGEESKDKKMTDFIDTGVAEGDREDYIVVKFIDNEKAIRDKKHAIGLYRLACIYRASAHGCMGSKELAGRYLDNLRIARDTIQAAFKANALPTIEKEKSAIESEMRKLGVNAHEVPEAKPAPKASAAAGGEVTEPVEPPRPKGARR